MRFSLHALISLSPQIASWYPVPWFKSKQIKGAVFELMYRKSNSSNHESGESGNTSISEEGNGSWTRDVGGTVAGVGDLCFASGSLAAPARRLC
jgi:hypothetical protein